MICVSLGRTQHSKVVSEHQSLADQGAELVELRLDWIRNEPDLNRLLAVRPTKIVITCRRHADGGRWRGNEDKRLLILRAAVVAGVDYVDLESDIARKIPRYGKTRRIISFHDFTGTPDNLDEIHKQLAGCDPDIIKIVTMANTPEDNVRILDMVQKSKIPTVGFCMGEYGLVSRLLCGRYGSPLTYATFSADRVIAPGQLAFQEMKNLYRYDQINRETRIFGVIGDPIGHSLSPLVHNTAYKEQNINAVYMPLRVPPEMLFDTLKAYDELGFSGFSVTIPHKQDVLQFAKMVSAHAQEIGAANTLFKNKDGEWCAANTDYDAGLAAIMLGLAQKKETSLNGQRVLVLGAGGAARAIGLACAKQGAVLTITNRTKARGAELAEEIGCQFVSWENRGSNYADVVVNCTPVGMSPDTNAAPFADHWLREETVVFDTIYNPETTLFIRNARERGCKVVTGVEMFVRQGAAQFKYFTGQNASLSQMRQSIRQGISPIRIKTATGHVPPASLHGDGEDEASGDD